MIKIKGGPKDINQLAKLVSDIATGQIDVPANGIVEVAATKTTKIKKTKKS